MCPVSASSDLRSADAQQLLQPALAALEPLAARCQSPNQKSQLRAARLALSAAMGSTDL